jgi:NAD(P)-dependent dehydrogenase (short-subunit alcohol dehydrogenase family)
MAIWFITGTSTGFGREIALEALARGDKVIATARKLSAIEDLAEKGAYTLSLDITSPEVTIKQTVAKAVEKYGGIDILVNNAGVGLLSCFEEVRFVQRFFWGVCRKSFADDRGSDEELRALFNVNYFGHANVTRAVLPYMRSKKSGVIGFIGSGAGRKTNKIHVETIPFSITLTLCQRHETDLP